MGLNGRDSSCNFVKVAASSSVVNKKKKNYYSDTREDKLCTPNSTASQNASIRLRIREMGPLCKARKKKAAQNLAHSRKDDEEDGEFAKQFGKEGIWPDDDKCMWLSSGSMSPSSCFDDYRFSTFLDLSLDEWLVSLLSISANSGVFLGSTVSFYDGSRVNPIEEAFLLLERTSFDEDRTLQEDLNEEEVVTWLVSSIGNDLTDSSVMSKESSSGQSLEYFSSCDDSSSPFSTNFDSPSRIWDSDRTDFWISLVNLDEDVEWISDRESKSDHFQADFPSASLESSSGSEVQFSSYSNPSHTDIYHEKSQSIASSDCVVDSVGFEDLDSDEPLFWPMDGESDWGSEVTCDFLIMSPRKTKQNVGTPERTSSKSFRLKLHNRKWNSEEGCRRRLVVGSGSTSSKILELNCTNGNKDYRRVNTMPSRLSKWTKNSMKVVPLDMEEDITEPTDKNVLIEKPADKFRSFLEGDFSSNEQLPIEKLLGLDEFDGQEGIESEFNKDDFSLGRSL
ncbi:uncharacterized protein LOC132275417 [Cornus florida]|uniref:uncharacterized protein LOC132275417 n=1 Tax=Cornus florida TaxID=4283 RepID=UPI00289C49C1|nr:uncharacterized protein LOC132275417 [Cornus florida]